MTAPIIEIEKMALSLPSAEGLVPILRAIDLSVAQGETLAITGASGSGKTSLMMIMAGLQRASGGAVRAAGMDLQAADENALASFRRAHVGIVFQSFHLIPTLNALENVMTPLELAGVADSRSRAKTALEQVGLSHRLSHYPSQLSGGEQQRVAITRAFVGGPSLLLADEPTGNLDHATGAQIIDLLFSLHASQGTTLILITHDTELAKRCSRRIVLSDGEILSA